MLGILLYYTRLYGC